MKLLKNWDFIRFLRLGIGLWIGYSAIEEQQIILGALASLFIIQSLLNIGCASGTCSTLPSARRPMNHKIEKTTFDEIK